MFKVPSNVFGLNFNLQFQLALSISNINNTKVLAPSRAPRQQLTLIKDYLLTYIQGTALPGRTISAQRLASHF